MHLSFLYILKLFYLAFCFSFYVNLSTFFISASHQSNISNFHLSFFKLIFSSLYFVLFKLFETYNSFPNQGFYATYKNYLLLEIK